MKTRAYDSVSRNQTEFITKKGKVVLVARHERV